MQRPLGKNMTISLDSAHVCVCIMTRRPEKAQYRLAEI